jgi:2-isopropylmalate synthase
MEKVYIFDTTLRDGEQSCGVSLSIKEKLDIARQLANLGVDIIEAGFPIASHGDFEAVQAIAEEIDGPVIAGLARVLPEDIERAASAIKPAKRRRLHIFLATSKIHMDYKLKKSKEEILKMAVEGVKLAKSFTDDVEFSPEDASRTEKSFLYEVLEATISAGATTVNIPDTVGYAMPAEFGTLIADIKRAVKNIGKAIISVHCHNDLGMAVANSLSAVMNGARQVECTMNGIGERAGNASLDEIVMAIKIRPDLFQLFTEVNTQHIYKTSKMVSGYTGMVVQPNKAVVGSNALAHSSGIHQDGFLKERTTYEIMRPEDIGLAESKIVLTKLSGRHALKKRLQDLGFSLTDEELSCAFKAFKELADKKKEIFDADIQALIEDEVHIPPERFKLDYLYVSCGTGTIPTATIRIKDGERLVQEVAWGNGPIDAIYLAIDKAIGISSKLKDYSVSALTGEKEAIGEVVVRIERGVKEITGRGISTDIIEASAKAYLSAINRSVQNQGF